jgi:hypothetical protein
MHTICLVYANSKFYNSTARIIVLMQVDTQILFIPLFEVLRKLAIF